MTFTRPLSGARRRVCAPLNLPLPANTSPWLPWTRRGQTWTSNWSPWKRWPRRPQSVALAVLLALLAPGLTIGALRVNDILKADLLPGTLFLREGPIVDLDVNATESHQISKEENTSDKRNGNWSDAFLTMNFHRKMMNEYLCRSYVAEQILDDMTEPVAVAAAAAVATASTANAAPAAEATTSAALTAERLRNGHRISSTLFVGGNGGRGDDKHAEDEASRDDEGADDDNDGDRSDRDAETSRHKKNKKPLDVGDLILSGAVNLEGPNNGSGPRLDTETETDAGAPSRRRDPPEARSNVPMFRKKQGIKEGFRGTKKHKKKRRRKKTKTRRVDLSNVKDTLLADEGSSSYKDWLSRSTLLEDIYRHYDHMALAASDSAPAASEEGTTTFEGGEVTGYALTPAVAPVRPVNIGLGHHHHHPHVPVVPLHPAHAHPGLSLASSINSFAAPASSGHSAIAASPPAVYGAPFAASPALGPLSGLSSPSHSLPAADVGERHPYEFSEEEHFVDHHPEPHHHEYHHEYHIEKGHGKLLSLKDLFDLVLTAIAFLAFGAYVMHLIMCLMYSGQPQMTMMEVPMTGGGDTGGGDDGAGAAEGGKRRRRSTSLGPDSALPLVPNVPVEVLNRAAQRVLATIDAALLQYAPKKRTAPAPKTETPISEEEDIPDDSECLLRALCKHNRFSRSVEGPFRLWMPIWSLGMSWVSGRLTPGRTTVAAATLDNLRASVLGLGNAKCHLVFPRCSLATRQRGRPPVYTGKVVVDPLPQPPPSTSIPDVAQTTQPTTLTSSSSPGPPEKLPSAPPAAPTPPAIVHPKFKNLLAGSHLIVTKPPSAVAPGPGVDTRFMPIGIKSNKKKRRRRPYASARAGTPNPG